MSGVMIKVAIYGLVRVLVEWVGILPTWFGVLVLGVGALSAVGGVVYALFQHDLKRLLALHSIENVGIIVLGSAPACSCGRRAPTSGRRSRSARPCCTRSTTGSSRRCSSSARARSRGGRLARAEPAGRALRACRGPAARSSSARWRSPGAAAERLRLEWLTLQALLHVPAYGGVDGGIAGAVALAALAATAALAVFCFVKVVGLVLLGPPRHAVRRWRRRSRLRTVVALAGACVVLARAGAALRLARRAGAVAGRRADQVGLRLPGAGSLPTAGSPSRWSGSRPASCSCAAGAARRADLGVRAARGASAAVDERGFTKPLRLMLEASLRPQREIVVQTAASCRTSLQRARAAPDRRPSLPARDACRAGGAVHARRLQSGRLGVRRVPDRARRRAPRRRADRSDRVSTATVTAGVAQVVGGLLLAPLLPASCSTGRPGCRDDAGRHRFSPTASCAASGARARSRSRNDARLPARARRDRRPPRRRAARPAAELAPNWGLGHDALALAGLLALARFAAAAAAWDVGNGFSMGASRDCSISVFVEATLVLSLAVAALVAGTTDLRGVVEATAGTGVWSSPALALGGVAFAVVVIAETGRQPVDNPDTHRADDDPRGAAARMRAGRDLAYLQWAAAARHWLVLVLAAQIFLPTRGVWWQLGLPPVARRLGRPVAEHTAKMRVLLVRACCRRARSSRCSASSPGSWRRRERDRPVGLAQRRARRGDRPPTLRRRRPGDRPGAPACSTSRSRAEHRRGCRRRRSRSCSGRPPSARSSSSSSPARRGGAGRRGAVRPRRPGGGVRARAPVARARDRARVARRRAGGARARRLRDGLAATRRPTLFQVLGIVLVENGLALAALELPGGSSSLAIELGVALDLTLIALVAAVFHERIFAEFGAGDTAALRAA